jgi:hypothetical protein
MAIAPVNPEPIRADQSQTDRADILGHARRIEGRAAGHFIDTLGTGTRQPEFPRGQPRNGAVTGPLEQDSIISPSDRGGDRRRSARTALLGYLPPGQVQVQPAPISLTIDRYHQVSK